MTYTQYVNAAFAGGVLFFGLGGIALARASAIVIIESLKNKRGQQRDNIDTEGNYTGTMPTFEVAGTSLATEANQIPRINIENIHPLVADGDYENYIYKGWLFPREVKFNFINYPRGFQGDTEDRRNRDPNRGGGAPPPPPPPPPPAPPTAGGGFGTGMPVPKPRGRPKDPEYPENSKHQADWYQKSNLHQRSAKAGEVKGRKYETSEINPVFL